MTKPIIFLLPFAGGSYYAYRELTKHLNCFETVPLDIPGHGKRLKEPLLKDLDSIADDVFSRIKTKLNLPYTIFGHSMGSDLSLLITRLIIKNRLPLPMHLFLSGRKGPYVPMDKPISYNFSKKKFIEKLNEYEGMPKEILGDPEILDFFLPIIRADMEAVETYQFKKEEPFDIPITVFIGLSDKSVTYNQAAKWQEVTNKAVDINTFEGGHFFLFGQEQQIADIIKTALLSNK